MYLFTMEANSTMCTWTLSDPPGSMRDVDLLIILKDNGILLHSLTPQLLHT